MNNRTIFVLELKAITANRCTNDGVTACYWNDTLVYCSPKSGPFIRSVAVEAADISAAMEVAIEKLREQFP